MSFRIFLMVAIAVTGLGTYSWNLPFMQAMAVLAAVVVVVFAARKFIVGWTDAARATIIDGKRYH